MTSSELVWPPGSVLLMKLEATEVAKMARSGKSVRLVKLKKQLNSKLEG